jgi:hypothetical protein
MSEWPPRTEQEAQVFIAAAKGEADMKLILVWSGGDLVGAVALGADEVESAVQRLNAAIVPDAEVQIEVTEPDTVDQVLMVIS